ncbi:MAG TPA: 50S ribosomal protein L9 [Pyrinomonadaceae bacterium]|nr:50S ribosomal protein L9 [Pyrinomonadaceae bacterium]
MATTTVLLREDVDSLGARGEIVKVKAGYARNYLLPRKLAVVATASNVKQIESERAALLKKEARERSTAEAQAAQMGALRLTFERKVGEHGLLYGSVTAMHVAEAIREKGYEIDRRRVHLPETIKEVGEYAATVRLHREVSVDIPVVVTGEGGAAPAAAASSAPAAAGSADAAAGTAGAASATEAGADEATGGAEG